ncbi:3644_t:CDS:2, partial [Gigaspora margarita]
AKYASVLSKAFGNTKDYCQQLLAQLASYQLNEPLYDKPFEPDYSEEHYIEDNEVEFESLDKILV